VRVPLTLAMWGSTVSGSRLDRGVNFQTKAVGEQVSNALDDALTTTTAAENR
jgi:hypothetical protein